VDPRSSIAEPSVFIFPYGILVNKDGQRFTDEVETEYQQILSKDGAPHTITPAELARVSANFAQPAMAPAYQPGEDSIQALLRAADETDPEYIRWLKQNVAAHKNPSLRAVTLSLKRLGQAPGDATADQLDRAAELATMYADGEAATTGGAAVPASDSNITNAEITKVMGRLLRRPTLATAPSFALKSVLGEFSTEVLGSARVMPEALIKAGFRFQDTLVDSAITQAIKGD
jgi:hypothetical protein